MGRKQARAGKPVRLCIAALILLVVSGCSAILQGSKANDGNDGRVHLDLARKSFVEGDYRTALRESEKATLSASSGPVAEEALLYMGLIYAHPANPNRDYGKSVSYLKKLIDGNQRSLFGEQAKIVVRILQQNDELGRTVERLNATVERSNAAVERSSATIQQSSATIQQLNATIQQLNEVINASKKVDIGIEEKKKGTLR